MLQFGSMGSVERREREGQGRAIPVSYDATKRTIADFKSNPNLDPFNVALRKKEIGLDESLVYKSLARRIARCMGE